MGVFFDRDVQKLEVNGEVNISWKLTRNETCLNDFIYVLVYDDTVKNVLMLAIKRNEIL